MEQPFEITRQIVAVKDIMSFWGKKERQSHKILSNAKKALGKSRHQPLTITEFAHYYGIPTEELKQHIAMADALKPIPSKQKPPKPEVKTLSVEELMNPCRKEPTYVFSPKPQ